MNSSVIDLVYAAEEIRREVAALGKRIEAEYRRSPPLVLSLLGGSLVFCADLVRTLTGSVRFELVQIVVQESEGQREPREIRFPISVGVEGERVLLVKDVVDTGVTEAYLEDELRELGAAEVRLAALVDMPGERKTDVRVDFPVFAGTRDGTLVGYGMKLDGHYGNLPFIGRIRAEDRSPARDGG